MACFEAGGVVGAGVLLSEEVTCEPGWEDQGMGRAYTAGEEQHIDPEVKEFDVFVWCGQSTMSKGEVV